METVEDADEGFMALCDRDPASAEPAERGQAQGGCRSSFPSSSSSGCARPLLSFARDRDLIPFELGSGGPTYKQASGPSELDTRSEEEMMKRYCTEELGSDSKSSVHHASRHPT